MDEDRAHRDRELATRISSGDAEALEAVYDAYAGAVYRQALSLLSSVPDAEDVLQEVFLKLVRRRGLPIHDLKAYLLTAARHQACSLLRQRQRTEPELVPEAVLAASAGGAEATADRLIVRQALQSLPTEQREVVELKIFEQLTFEEIGRVVKASVNTVASRYRYALKKLRQALGDYSDAP